MGVRRSSRSESLKSTIILKYLTALLRKSSFTTTCSSSYRGENNCDIINIKKEHLERIHGEYKPDENTVDLCSGLQRADEDCSVCAATRIYNSRDDDGYTAGINSIWFCWDPACLDPNCSFPKLANFCGACNACQRIVP